jgi:F0F1-type ATP synthase membrane subunit b/b'
MAKVFGSGASSKVNSARKQAVSALGLFAKANAKLQKANEKLLKTEDEARQEAEALIQEATRARAERESNQLVQEKLKDFIPQV